MSDAKPPEIIYLQCDEDGWADDETTWCRNKINDQDIKYVRAEHAPTPVALQAGQPGVAYSTDEVEEAIQSAFDGWIPYDGSGMPVDGDTMVDVKFRSSNCDDDNPSRADSWNWRYDHGMYDRDIIAYRIAKAAADAGATPVLPRLPNGASCPSCKIIDGIFHGRCTNPYCNYPDDESPTRTEPAATWPHACPEVEGKLCEVVKGKACPLCGYPEPITAPAADAEATLEHFQYSPLLNELDEMQQSFIYATRKDTLRRAEMAIVDLERNHRLVQRENEELQRNMSFYRNLAATNLGDAEHAEKESRLKGGKVFELTQKLETVESELAATQSARDQWMEQYTESNTELMRMRTEWEGAAKGLPVDLVNAALHHIQYDGTIERGMLAGWIRNFKESAIAGLAAKDYDIAFRDKVFQSAEDRHDRAIANLIESQKSEIESLCSAKDAENAHLRRQIGYIVTELMIAGDKRSLPEIVETAAKATEDAARAEQK